MSHEFYLTDRAETLCGRATAAPGRERLPLSIAGMDIELSGLSAEQLARALREYESVIGDASSSWPFELAVLEAGPAWFRPVDLAGGEYRVALSHDAAGAWVSGLHFVARLERGPRPSMKLWVERGTLDGFEGALINSLRVLVAHCLLSRDGVVLHSAAVESAGRAFVFFGPSGAGKSTLSRISAATGRAVISDELNALVPGPDGFEVLALPFAGDFGRTAARRAPTPLGGIFRLRQAPEHALAELSKGTAIATLFASCPYVNSDPVSAEHTLSLVQQLVHHVRLRELSFSLDGAFWSLVDAPRDST